MKAFTRLFAELDSTTATRAKVDALKRYFTSAAPADAAWAVYFLAGGKPRQVVPTGSLWRLACERAGIDEWLFDECYQAVGDLAETIALVLPPAGAVSDVGLAVWVEERLLPLRGLAPAEQMHRIAGYWDELDLTGRFLLNKLIGGSFRVGVSKLLVQRALAELSGVDAKLIAQRMMGYTDIRAMPSAERYAQLTASGEALIEPDRGQPFPFFLAHQLDAPLDQLEARLGATSEWLVEWKYDGIRGQLVKRGGETWIWSRGEDLVTERFPELVALARRLPDGTVLDGEIVVFRSGRPAPFGLLQQRIGRKTLSKKILADAPVGFIAYDLLEWQGVDLRGRSQAERREALEAAIESVYGPAAVMQDEALEPSSGVRIEPDRIHLSPLEQRPSWAALAELREASRERGVEGLMLKHRAARYGTGRTKAEGVWWKWKIDPFAVDAVLIYAQPGSGRRASVHTDYTFAVWNRTPEGAAEAAAAVDAIAERAPLAPEALQLVSFAKAYSGLTDEEFKAVDRIIRKTTIEKFGPVRSLKPTLVFELGFEAINRSTRHKSGIAVRFPRMLRIRSDKPLHEADSLQTLEALLAGTAPAR